MLVHLVSAVPWKNQSLPLSATIRPYVFMVLITVWQAAEHCDGGRAKLAASLNRAPIGGQLVST